MRGSAKQEERGQRERGSRVESSSNKKRQDHNKRDTTYQEEAKLKPSQSKANTTTVL